GDEVVVSRLDSSSNVAPWRRTAQRAGATVRWGEIDIETCELPAWQYDDLVTSRTRLVAITAASCAVGTCPDLERIARAARAEQALVVVDAHAAAAFQPLDMRELGVDVLALAAQAWGGPPVGALAFADADLLDRLPSCALTPHTRGPGRLELGPHAQPMLAGLVASVDYLAGLDDAARGSRRERLRTSIASMREYQIGLLTELVSELRWQGHVSLIGDPRNRVPVVAFTVTGRKAGEVVDHLATRGVCVSGDNGRDGVFGALGVAEVGGAVRVGLGHYTSPAEVARLSSAVSELR
ncbi:MAG: aminotransferase class V-fold PLP-dependent enzyme, partial [Sciscionella sp.]